MQAQHKYSLIPHVRSGSCMVFSIPKVEISAWSEKWKKFITVYEGETSSAMIKLIRVQAGTAGIIRYVTIDKRGGKKEHYSTKLLISLNA